ncbi:MAG: transcriptional regulator, TetR family [Clostridia bacterium]|jgi:AcrR family transcriptional regulator|nr:transcriptional regulator, TetR family [Clostridia bacterium]
MPLQTFFNLSEDKRRTILRAARQEFSRVPLEQASIANIIKIAGIPRGSFYQYFYNKEDLFIFMIQNIGNKVIGNMITYLKENGGDVIEAFIQLFYNAISFIHKDENGNFFKNVFMSMNDQMKESIHASFETIHYPMGFCEFIKLIDCSKLTLTSEKEILYVLRMIKGILFQNVAHYFTGKMTEEETIETFLFQMKIIRQSIYKA